jgi:hypothetical protein
VLTEPLFTQPLDGEVGRRERGAFYTPAPLATGICCTLNLLGLRPRRILEPGCGGGAFLSAAQVTWPGASLLGVDLLPACTGPGEVRAVDLFDVTGEFDAVIGNPDFAIAERVVRHSLALTRPGGHVALLLRSSFLSSASRVALYEEHPLWALQPIAQRPSFIGGGSDSADYALFVWRRGFAGLGQLLPPLRWK